MGKEHFNRNNIDGRLIFVLKGNIASWPIISGKIDDVIRDRGFITVDELCEILGTFAISTPNEVHGSWGWRTTAGFQCLESKLDRELSVYHLYTTPYEPNKGLTDAVMSDINKKYRKNYDKITEEFYKDLDEYKSSGMSQETFNKLLDELDGNSLETLKKKNANYSKDDDKLHNFRTGADFTGQTVAQTCWGYMSKHLVSLQDKVLRNDFSDREDFLEKCQDTINYIRFLWCIGNEENNKLTNNKGE